MAHRESLRHRAPLLAVATVAVAISVAGCASKGAPPQVASLPTSTAVGSGRTRQAGGAPPPTPSTVVAARPRERLDESSSELQALFAPYQQCLGAHGFRKSSPGSGGSPGSAAEISPGVVAAAQVACARLEPLPPWQYDPANPKALGFVEQVVACLHQHGVTYAQAQDPPGQGQIEIALGGPQNDQNSISKGLDLIPACNEEVLRASSGS